MIGDSNRINRLGSFSHSFCTVMIIGILLLRDEIAIRANMVGTKPWL